MNPKRLFLSAVAAAASCTLLPAADDAADATPTIGPSLIKNGSMERAKDGWPEDWPKHKSAAYVDEDGNHFLRLDSKTPGETVLLYQQIPIPAKAKALRLTWKQRTSNLQPGSQPWYDARIMLEFRNSGNKKLPGSPSAPYSRKSSDAWETRSKDFLVPEGASFLAMMPSLFQVKSGTLDLDDFELRKIRPEPLLEAKKAAEAAKTEKAAAAVAKKQEKAAYQLTKYGNLISNGDFESPGRTDLWPAGWPDLKGNGSWENHPDGGRFLRMTCGTPGETVLMFRNIDLPANVNALDLSWKWRVSGLKPGKMPWFDARVLMDFKDVSGNKLKPQPSAPYTRRDTPEGTWQEKTVNFLVPDGAVSLDLMPALFQVQAGTIDFDNIVLKPVDSAPVLAKQKEHEAAKAKTMVPAEEPMKDKWPKEIRVVGNRILDSDDKEVWLQGLNIPSLEWSLNGEQVLKSTVVAIEEWKSNVIRIPMKEEYWFGRGGQTDGGESYRKLIDQMITLAANRGAYVILDLHRYRAPKPEFVEFWKDAATRYQNHPALIFDLMNEPHGINWEIWRNGGWVGDKKDADQAAFLSDEEKKKAQGFESPGMQAMLDAVRSTGARNVVLAGALDYAYQLDGILNGYALEDKAGNGIIYASHVYPWKKGWQKYFLDCAAKHPVLLGEVGGDAKKMDFMPHNIQEDVDTWAPDMLAAIQKYKLHWTGWCFHPKASPRMILDWDYTPTPFWGQLAKDALSGKQFEMKKEIR
ncbi:MAG: cellulase family glycosylhydrolase [Akkermansiaceae bacterium]|nr:cellulase family glycosylhydrolase [Akkermansiaceae bacterium]